MGKYGKITVLLGFKFHQKQGNALGLWHFVVADHSAQKSGKETYWINVDKCLK